MPKFIKFFEELGIKDVPQVGGKNASLGEMYQKLTKQGVNIPNGFATTAEGYRFFFEKTGLKKQIHAILDGLDTHKVVDLDNRAKKVRAAIIAAKYPDVLKKEIIIAYRKLSAQHKTKNLHVAVRSSATAEDLPDASFAGQQDTYLNVSGEEALLKAVQACIASLFTGRAISYRVDKKFDHFSIALSVGVQKMVRSDLASSGVMFSIDTESGFAGTVLINSIYGLGENIVQGKVNPDEFLVFKPTMKIISKRLGSKKIKMVYDMRAKAKRPVKDVPVAIKDEERYSITNAQALTLANWAVKIEKHYKRPMDMEWALDGNEKKLYIVQARPETIQSVRDYSVIEEYVISKKTKILARGRSVGNKIGNGVVNKIMSVKDIGKFKQGEVLVTDMTDPDWEPIMKIASAIVTDKGGRTCHAAIISRELGIPCVVGTEKGSQSLTTGEKITVSCAEGDDGYVYEGVVPFKVNKTSIKDLQRPKKTKIMMNIGSPDIAFASSFIPNDGVGLAREEFIINNHIKIHPLALVNFNTLKDKKLKKQIGELTVGYKDKKQYFVDKLAEGVGVIAAAFYPKDVIVRLSDFKTNEYANLIGGTDYEPIESNPMIGWRGASRYYDPRYKAAFILECKALQKAREEMGLTNIKIMIPICRTVEEGQKVLDIMADNGLKRGVKGLQVYVMAEIPTNIILADRFAKIFDGFSIGSNDLTQFTLGIDRDAGDLHVAGIANEKNESVKMLIRFLIEVGKKTGKKVGICGQAPSDFPDFARFLTDAGIDSISLNPDTVIKTTMDLADYEKNKKEVTPRGGARKKA
ncbi:phosphoenolpyruvate synthase [Candidatus Falkowbacteria bacterium CG10_big_fil_rev_8_21_14_0_10_37_14]|uniref:Phosphoenolpyruvate synthase n=1 Tax=Candidatus Falkowbacteria bacterium CG10_big_fil_rev_8_21_14_0_10_37_14 TaxID=1974561 RepID=A0A2M6WUB7_9BACT|nr:phosphoenolpyruvate synthase [Candidatus Falkowbacteria bacterium]PIT96374.1 MAG: phosphoenolpyruvate synthase [Candidatus Falkowbacteria bacterium CG10_big_fil_rev_8_21_14_0_10_37_14]